MDKQPTQASMGTVGRALEAVFRFLCSLKLAVVIILALAASLAVATVLESMYDTPTGQYYVYRALWFQGILGMLGVTIFCVAVSRWPWQRKHIPFLLAHLGILMLLGGAWATQQFGLDGNLRAPEGQVASVVELDVNQFVVTEGDKVHRIPVQWRPPGVEFRPFSTRDHGLSHDLTIDKFLSHADAQYSFIPVPANQKPDKPRPAVKMQLKGGPMGITQDLWLWTGEPSMSVIAMGPAVFSLGPSPVPPPAGRPGLSLLTQGDGSLAYKAYTSDGKVVEGRFAADGLAGQVIEPGWKGGLKATLLELIPDATAYTTYKDARIQYGPMAPPSAIHVVSGSGGEGAETWLGLGDRATLRAAGGNVEIAYQPQRVMLPFGVRLERFQIERYEGSMDPASYWSNVTVLESGGDTAAPVEKGPIKISMNEPLTHKGITLYQASYEDARPRPTVSIFSVNRDPGRAWKYWGSLLLVIGSIALFAVKYRKARTVSKGVA